MDVDDAIAGRAEVTVEFDHHAAELARDPYPTYQRLREESPVAWSPAYGGFWALSDYPTVHAASRDDDAFRSTPGVGIPLQPYGIQNIPIDTDSPQTQQYRATLLRAYSPASVTRLTPKVTAIADELLDTFADAGRADLVREYAMPLPARMILGLLGLPETDWLWWVERTHTVVHDITHNPDAAIAAGMEMAEAVAHALAERRTDGYRDDQISLIMQGTVDGRALTEQELISYVLLMIFGGSDTTTGATANALMALDRDRALRRRLIDRPADLPKAVEEFLRHQAPVQALARTLSRDVRIGDQVLRAGDRALLIWAAANRDPNVFERPDQVDIDRFPNRHLSFGVGLHRCLGSTLGRMMLRVMLERLLATIPDYQLGKDPEQYRFADASVIYSARGLPATFTPRAAS
jgi:hypothetical protein